MAVQERRGETSLPARNVRATRPLPLLATSEQAEFRRALQARRNESAAAVRASVQQLIRDGERTTARASSGGSCTLMELPRSDRVGAHVGTSSAAPTGYLSSGLGARGGRSQWRQFPAAPSDVDGTTRRQTRAAADSVSSRAHITGSAASRTPFARFATTRSSHIGGGANSVDYGSDGSDDACSDSGGSGIDESESSEVHPITTTTAALEAELEQVHGGM